MVFDVIAFDGDDTLWQNETLYIRAQDKLKVLLSNYVSPILVDQRLWETESKNLGYYGYGIKSFGLSMIEVAIEVTEGKITGEKILSVLALIKEMLTSEVVLFEHAEETLRQLSERVPLMLITKGDLLDQQAKLSRSGIGNYFRDIEIVSEKDEKTYRALLQKYRIEARRFLMVGNSLKSDILPVLTIGGNAVYIPYEMTWIHENIDEMKKETKRYYEIEHIGRLLDLIEKVNATGWEASERAQKSGRKM